MQPLKLLFMVFAHGSVFLVSYYNMEGVYET